MAGRKAFHSRATRYHLPDGFDGEHARTTHLILNPRDGGFQIKSRQRLSDDEWTLHASGRILEAVNRIPVARIDAPAVSAEHVGHEIHYQRASQLGLDYGPGFQGVSNINIAAERLEATLSCPELQHFDDYLLHPAILDLCFQSLIDFFGEAIDAGQGIALLPRQNG